MTSILRVCLLGTTLGLFGAAFVCSTVSTAAAGPALVLDETVWVTFYDVPSRRFRAIRDAYIRKDFVTAARDLEVAVGFLSVELDRAPESLEPAMAQLVATLENLRVNIFDQTVSVGDLDAAFARGHWLLAQHFLVLARGARDASNPTAAGDYMWASAHHLERTAMWSNATIDKDLIKSLDATRKMAMRLRDEKIGARAFRDKPVAALTRTLVRMGEQLDRPVRIDLATDRKP